MKTTSDFWIPSHLEMFSNFVFQQPEAIIFILYTKFFSRFSFWLIQLYCLFLKARTLFIYFLKFYFVNMHFSARNNSSFDAMSECIPKQSGRNLKLMFLFFQKFWWIVVAENSCCSWEIFKIAKLSHRNKTNLKFDDFRF